MMFFLALVLSCPVTALPLSNRSAATTKTYMISALIVVAISLFFLVSVKFVYMKYRRIGTIHAPPDSRSSSSTSSFGLRGGRQNRHRGLLVGFLGSPTWEANLMSRLGGVAWRRRQRQRPFVYPRYSDFTMRSTRSSSSHAKLKNPSSSSCLSKSTFITSNSFDVNQLLPSSYSAIPGRSLGGERRASPSSIRLVDGPTHSNQVEYSFLSGLPPDAIMLSPLMSTRDSILLSRCSTRRDRNPAPPMPPLPSFLAFHLPKDANGLELQSSKRFSPLAGVAKVFHAHRGPVSDENKMASLSVARGVAPLHLGRKRNTRSRLYMGLGVQGRLLEAPLVNEIVPPPRLDSTITP